MSRRGRRWDTWTDRQCRDHELWGKLYRGTHGYWWARGQEQLAWEEWVKLHPEDADAETPF